MKIITAISVPGEPSDCDCDCAGIGPHHNVYITYLECGHSIASNVKPVGATSFCPRCRTRQKVLTTRPAGNGAPAKLVPQLASVVRANAYIDHILAKLGDRNEAK